MHIKRFYKNLHYFIIWHVFSCRTVSRNGKIDLPSARGGAHYWDDHLQPLGEWLHIAGSYDFHEKTFSLFVNGQLISKDRYVKYVDGIVTLGPLLLVLFLYLPTFFSHFVK